MAHPRPAVLADRQALMICYASRTGTRRNLAVLRAAGWRLLISRAGKWQTHNFTHYAIDNGAWADFQQGTSFDANRFEALIDRLGQGADWIILPDIVAGGLKSLELSTRWLNRCLSVCPLVLLAVQDGMTTSDLQPLVSPSVGIFLGGSTEWKLSTMESWGEFCALHHLYFHIGRVNTLRRFALAHAAGATSVDGSSATRYAHTMPLLDRGSKQLNLLNPRTLQP